MGLSTVRHDIRGKRKCTATINAQQYLFGVQHCLGMSAPRLVDLESGAVPRVGGHRICLGSITQPALVTQAR